MKKRQIPRKASYFLRFFTFFLNWKFCNFSFCQFYHNEKGGMGCRVDRYQISRDSIQTESKCRILLIYPGFEIQQKSIRTSFLCCQKLAMLTCLTYLSILFQFQRCYQLCMGQIIFQKYNQQLLY